MAIQRDRGLTVRMTSDELVKLAELAEHEGLSQSDVVRRFIRRGHAAIFGATKPAKKRAAAKGKRG